MYRKKKIIDKTSKPQPPPVYKLSDDVKQAILSQSYIGKKGYTIPKTILPNEELEFLTKDLYLKPEVMGAGARFAPNSQDNTAFPVYRENDKKIYIPRFYGIHRYGRPTKCELDPGLDINVPFAKELRDYQENIIDIYMKYVNNPNTHGQGSGGILQVPCGAGKCMGIDTPILMYDGTIKLVQDIKVGDVLMGDDSTPRNVLSLARGKETMYKVNTKKGNGYIVNESHILSLKYSSKVNKHTPKNSVIDIPVLDYLNLPKSYHGRGGVLLGYRVPILFKETPVEIDPYLLGYWLGDGSSNGTLITTQESSVIKYLVDCFKTKHTSLYFKYTGQQYDYMINSIKKNNILMDFLRGNNLINNKHIPLQYKSNSRKIQLELLAGLIDSDGYYNSNCYEIFQKNENLLDDIVFLAKSLGFSAYKKQVKKTCTNSANGRKEGIYYITNICGEGLEEIPVKCMRKKAHKRKLLRDCLKYRIKLENIGIGDYYGFEIDGNHRFVLGDFTVTHNTVMGLKIISLLKKKTLILVHKEFLMNQWIERINEFLPTATIGKIQANVCDYHDKDIVIGMIQTMYNKTFPQEVYSQFGLTVIDEVHRIGSEEFSKTLLKTITPYMLGISATVERKDKLTKLLYMFIGEKIYSEDRKKGDEVCVRGIEYHTNDEDFNAVECDFRGQPKFSTMISKLSDYGPRNDFIVRVAHDLLEENPEGQIMILGHNRSMLKYLYEAITHRQIATVGYYVGGMKQADLQASETKQIVLATYAMAAEALDIKTLSMMIMATPKTDITQSVGRILRMKHDNPVVVDIVDMHELFQNQWKLRKRFYKKCNYRIRSIDNKRYSGMSLDWDTDKTWTWVFEPKNDHITSTTCSSRKDAVVKSDSDPEENSKDTTTIFKGKCFINMDDL
jgi:superfamily II DNA or RNA helicase